MIIIKRPSHKYSAQSVQKNFEDFFFKVLKRGERANISSNIKTQKMAKRKLEGNDHYVGEGTN